MNGPNGNEMGGTRRTRAYLDPATIESSNTKSQWVGSREKGNRHFNSDAKFWPEESFLRDFRPGNCIYAAQKARGFVWGDGCLSVAGAEMAALIII